MRLLIALVVMLAAPLATFAVEPGETDDIDPEVEMIIDAARHTRPATQVTRGGPRYPGVELSRGREAWAHITYCIDESGSVQNVSILDSVGNERFDAAAIKTIKNWTYEPALQSGKPVWQSKNNILVTFALSDKPRGAQTKFIRHYKRLGKLIDADELEQADVLFWKVYKTFDLSLYEVSMLWVQRVRYESRINDLYKMHMALIRATASHGEWIKKKTYRNLLRLTVQTEIELGQFASAKHSFEHLVDLAGEESTAVKDLAPAVEAMNQLVASKEVFAIPAEVRVREECAYCDNSWYFTPTRSDFAIRNVQGKLTTLDMRCEHKRYEAPVSDSVDWHIPETWGSCQIQIYGDPGTTFDLIMLPLNNS